MHTHTHMHKCTLATIQLLDFKVFLFSAFQTLSLMQITVSHFFLFLSKYVTCLILHAWLASTQTCKPKVVL